MRTAFLAVALLMLLTVACGGDKGNADTGPDNWQGGPLDTPKRQKVEARLPNRTWSPTVLITDEYYGEGPVTLEVELGSPPLSVWWDTRDPDFAIAVRLDTYAVLVREPNMNIIRLADLGGTAQVAIVTSQPWTLRVLR